MLSKLSVGAVSGIQRIVLTRLNIEVSGLGPRPAANVSFGANSVNCANNGNSALTCTNNMQSQRDRPSKQPPGNWNYNTVHIQR